MFSSPKEDRSGTEDGWQAISDLFSVVKRSMASALGASESVSDYSPGGYSVFASKTTDPEKILADIDTIAVKLNAAKQEAQSTRAELDDLLEAKRSYTETRTWELEQLEEMTGENIRLREAAGRVTTAEEALKEVKRTATEAAQAAAAEYRRLKTDIEAETDRMNAKMAANDALASGELRPHGCSGRAGSGARGSRFGGAGTCPRREV